jgi:hypothetical protein
MAALAASSRPAAAKLPLHTKRFMSPPLIVQLTAQTVAGRRSIPGQKVFAAAKKNNHIHSKCRAQHHASMLAAAAASSAGFFGITSPLTGR